MARLHRPRSRRNARAFALVGVGALLWLPLATRAGAPSGELPLRVLIVGGGPNLINNQVAIESNVRYVEKLLPPNAPRTTLFADGDANHATVLYDDDVRAQPIGEQLFSLINPNSNDPSGLHYRKPNLGVKIEGASKQDDISRAFGQIAQAESADPGGHQLLLYFTGHGSPGRQNYDNNLYDLWEDGRGAQASARAALTVRDLSHQIARLPNDVPVTLVMVQCFSGAFANLIFENGDPKGDLVKRDLCGFFATVPNRVAAGCTSAVNEAEYRDFTSFFFAALTGKDRVGRRVTGADYNGDGRVGMDEAYCYTLIHDDSIDAPVCTSDAFLRRFVSVTPAEERELFQTSYRDARQWASIPQRAALDALSDKLRLGGNSRLSAAYAQFVATQNQAGPNRRQMGDYRAAHDRFRAIQSDSKSMLLRQFPNLKLSDPAARREARQAAIAQLTREANQNKWQDLLDADAAVDKAERTMEEQEIAGSQIIRFVRLAKSVILAHRLNEGHEAGLKERYARLIASEVRTLLPPADAQNKDTALVK